MRFQAISLLAVAGLVLFTGVTLVGPFSAMRRQLLSINSLENKVHQHLWAIILDAGSTGTRLHVFTFYNHTTSGQLVFESEQYFHTEPGLSHYADDPGQAAISIIPLLKDAQKVIPANKWDTTPIALKATAGLRLLPPEAAEAILFEIRELFHHFSLNAKNDSAVIMDGVDEGYFAWYTVNYLLGFLGNKEKSVAVLDLGGASTQVTFAPADTETLVRSPSSHITTKMIMDKVQHLYTHSYLGFGLMSARQAIIVATTPDPSIGEDDIMDVVSPCFPSNMQHNWFHAGQEYRILGMGSSWNRFAECAQQAKFFVMGRTHLSEELTKRNIYLLSYYFDRAADSRMIDRRAGGKPKVKDYATAAKSVCAKNSPEKPFLCLDLTYIATLLQYGFGLDNQEVTLVKKIDGVESSWALGAAFDLISNAN